MPVAGRGDDTMSALKSRNITASVDDPVETWPYGTSELLMTVVEARDTGHVPLML